MKSLYQYILEHLTISIMENETTSKYKKFEEFVNNAKNDIDKHKKSIEFFKNLKNSLRLTLRSLLMNGCEVNVNNFNHIVNGKPSAKKQKTECVRGNFGPDLETSKNVINFILKEKFYLTDKDFTISDFAIHPNVSSNSKPSCEIRFNNEVFYVCNNKISSNNETIIFTSKNFLINNLVDANHIYDKDELIKTVNTKLEKIARRREQRVRCAKIERYLEIQNPSIICWHCDRSVSCACVASAVRNSGVSCASGSSAAPPNEADSV